MSEATPSGSALRIPIRYQGRDADSHRIDLMQLGQSLQGMARVIAVSAHFVQTGKISRNFQALDVKVLAAPVREHHCYEVMAVIQETGETLGLWSGLGTAVVIGIVGYVFNRHKDKEMKHLSEALRHSQWLLAHSGEKTHASLLAVIEKLADALQPAARQALTPVGKSVASIHIHDGENPESSAVVLDASTRAAIDRPESASHITAARVLTGLITEMDMLGKTCKVTLEGDDSEQRIPAEITDPVASQPGNPYASAMARMRPIRFIAKMQLAEDGQALRLYISDTVPDEPQK